MAMSAWASIRSTIWSVMSSVTSICGKRAWNSAKRGAMTCSTKGTGAFTRSGPRGARLPVARSASASVRTRISRAAASRSRPSGVTSIPRVDRRSSVTDNCASNRVTVRLRVEGETPSRRPASAKPPFSITATKAARSAVCANCCVMRKGPVPTQLFPQKRGPAICKVERNRQAEFPMPLALWALMISAFAVGTSS